MNEGMPYLKMRRGVWVSFCKIAIFSFLSVGYKLDGLYCRMAGTPSSPTLFFIRVEILLERSGCAIWRRVTAGKTCDMTTHYSHELLALRPG